VFPPPAIAGTNIFNDFIEMELVRDDKNPGQRGKKLPTCH